MDYRVVSRAGQYIAQCRCQFLFWSYWEDMFCGSHSDLPQEFPTPEAAMQEVRRLDFALRRAAQRAGYCQTFFISSDGGIHLTHDGPASER